MPLTKSSKSILKKLRSRKYSYVLKKMHGVKVKSKEQIVENSLECSKGEGTRYTLQTGLNLLRQILQKSEHLPKKHKSKG